MPPRYDLAEQLINHAQGLHAATAAIELLCAHRAWLGKPPFIGRCAITGARASGGPYAYIDWSDAIDRPRTPVSTAATSRFLITAVLHASRQRPAHRRP